MKAPPILITLTAILSLLTACHLTERVFTDNKLCDVLIDMTYEGKGLIGKWTLLATGPSSGSPTTCKPLEIKKMTLEFKANGSIAGISSCNNYTGTYQFDENTLAFSGLSYTEKACGEPEGVIMTWEQHLQRGFQGTTSYELRGNSLHLKTNNDTDLFFLLAVE